jgi:hypothetical protein
MKRIVSTFAGAPVFVFLAVLSLVLLVGRNRLCDDPGTFWHLRLGRDIAATGAVPRVDTLTYTRSGTTWVDQSWLFDLGLASLVGWRGWSAAVALAALILAAVYAFLAYDLVRAGRSPIVAAVTATVAAGIGAVHFHCRPHLFTIAGVALTLAAARAWHSRNSRVIWLVPLGMIAWANLHGGFVAGPVILATAIVGALIERSAKADPNARSSPAKPEGSAGNLTSITAVLALSILAPLLNPYGINLYRHVWQLMVSSRVTDLISEYQPARLGEPGSAVLEMVVLSLVAFPVLSRERPTRYELAHVLVWLHFGLGSIRHAPLLAIAVAPTFARYIDGTLQPNPITPAAPHRRWLVAPGLVSLALLAAVALGAPIGGPSAPEWPLTALPTLNQQPADARLFHDQDWGGLVECESSPPRLAYIDDRFELWGREPILAYVRTLQGGPEWDHVAAREHFDLVWIRPNCGLAQRLADDSGWTEIHRDQTSVLFRKNAPVEVATH